MARRRKSNRRRRGSFGFLYKLLSVLVICGAIVAAMTLFFRVDTVVITGQQRYTEEEIREASGIAEGVTGTTFCPDEAVTREQTATFLYRYVTEYLGLTPEQSGDLSGYSDSARISTYAREAVAWAVSESFLEGYGDGTLRPRANLTRAQMAKFLTILAQDF